MKKIIFASLAVLSLGLFSFTPAPTSQPGIWVGSDCGNFIIDDGGSTMMTPADQDMVKSLLSVMYNVPSDQDIDGEPIPAAKGKCVFHHRAVVRQIDEDLVKWDNATVQAGTTVAQLRDIVAQYAQPMPSQPAQ
jgi:hypothetical protein